MNPESGPNRVQRIESGAIGVFALASAIVLYPAWWWLVLAAFILFDLSALGYLRSPAAGASSYNAVHNYAWPAIAAMIAVASSTVAPPLSMWCGLVACSWAFHVAADRALGYGIKLPDAFSHTHLGWTGRAR
jgi:hypothetical protein